MTDGSVSAERSTARKKKGANGMMNMLHAWRRLRRRTKAALIVLTVLWLLAGSLTVVTSTEARGVGAVAAILFVCALVFHLGRSRPYARDLPDMVTVSLPRLKYLPALALTVGVLLALFWVGGLFHPWLVLVTALTSIALWVIGTRRRQLSHRPVLLGVAAGALCLLLALLGNRLDGYQAFYLACVPLLFIAGVLLTRESNLARVRSADGAWRLSLRGFATGCLLAVPAALLNVADGASTSDAWVDRPWEPLIALVPGIAEETWARLFMTTLIYAILRPRSRPRPTRAVTAAVLIAAFAHSLVHLSGSMIFSPAAIPALLNGLLFGVPLGLLFVKRDFEHAVGYHFFIDFVRFGAALEQA